MQDRAEGRPLLAALASQQPRVGVCTPSAAWREQLLHPAAFYWLQQLLRLSHGRPGLAGLAAPARQLLVRCPPRQPCSPAQCAPSRMPACLPATGTARLTCTSCGACRSCQQQRSLLPCRRGLPAC